MIPNLCARPIKTVRRLGGRWLAQGWRPGLDFLLPPTCLSCDAPLSGTAAEGLCPACWFELERLTPDQLRAGQGKSYTLFQAPFAYAGPAATLVKRLKYQDQLRLAPWMARQLTPFLSEAPVVLVPVPLHYRRLWQRKYNQAAVLAKALARLHGCPWRPEGLRRIRPTTRQVGQRASRRRQQLAGAFVASPAVAGCHVVLIDDVLTTGSTAESCAQALLAAGATQVDVLTFAYTLPQSV